MLGREYCLVRWWWRDRVGSNTGLDTYELGDCERWLHHSELFLLDQKKKKSNCKGSLRWCRHPWEGRALSERWLCHQVGNRGQLRTGAGFWFIIPWERCWWCPGASTAPVREVHSVNRTSHSWQGFLSLLLSFTHWGRLYLYAFLWQLDLSEGF